MIVNWFVVECNLCGQEFEVDKDFSYRGYKHKEYHRPNKKRASNNIVKGVVEWIIKPQ